MSRADKLIERAKAATSLNDFGGDDFREGLEVLVASVDDEAQLNEVGRAGMEGQIVYLLAQRLEIEHWYALHPEIDEQEIVAPLVGIGLPRTGSSALACMLGEDPAVRSLRTWEMLNPCPPPDVTTQHNDPRLAKADEAMARRARLFPRMTAMLPTTTTSPTECQTFMGYSFKSQVFQSCANIPAYMEWLHHRADMVPTYRYLKRVLKLLQWRCPPNRWRLKNPSHSMFIGAFSQVFPDARFVMTHRDVASVIPSQADLYLEMRKAYSDHVDKLALGRTVTDINEIGMRRMVAFRDAGNDQRFFDVYFAPFQQDPYPILTELYAFLGEQLTPETKARMEAWRKAMPRDEQGYERSNMADFGLNADSIRERFRFYSDRFNVPLISARSA